MANIPYTQNPTFWDITFGDRLSLKVHVDNLMVRTLKRFRCQKNTVSKKQKDPHVFF